MAQAASTYLGEQRRRSTRLDHALPIVVRGVDLLGQPFEERTATQVLSFHGCRYASKHHLPKNTWLTLEVAASEPRRELLRVRARVAWIQRPRTLRELFHVGVELESGANIWGVAVPPEDWSAATASSAGTTLEVTPFPAGSTESPSGAGPEPTMNSQDTYLEHMLAESVRNPAGGGPFSSHAPSQEFAPLLREMREHFDVQARHVLDEARAHAEQLVHDRTAELQRDLYGELRAELKKEQRISAETFLQRWREEFEKEQASAKKEISSTLTQQMAAQVSQTQEGIRAKLKVELESGIEQARAALAEWRRQAEAFQAEARSISESLAGRAEQRLEEKLAEQLTSLRQELVSSGVAVPVAAAPAMEDPTEVFQTWRARFDSEMAMTRAQWSELLESSLDSAAQRLVERLAENSQRLLQSTEQKLAVRIAELEQESGRAAETARATMEEIKSAFDREVTRAKNSLEEFEKAAGRFAESSRQLEAAREGSLSELRSRLEATIGSSAAEMEKRAGELLKRVTEQVGQALEEKGQQATAHAAAEAESQIAPSIERAAEASRQLEARQQHTEEVLRVHRERLRQISEQTQREVSEQASTTVANLWNHFEATRKDALAKWFTELEAGGARAASEASGLLAKTAETTAADCSQKIRKNAEEALERFSTESNSKAEQSRVHLAAAAEQAVQNFQGYAQSALGHFQEQIAAKMDQSMRQSQELLAAQLVATFDSFQEQGDTQVKEWSGKLEAESASALERHENRLHSAGDAWVDASVQQLEAMGQTRVDALIHAAEAAMRKACVQALNGMAETIREEFSGEAADATRTGPQPINEASKTSQPAFGESKPTERRASA
ncbi:MAG TPA: PilZ domain-containing protein [Candidatus Acidoferrales bacterium]|nr:PilZ domain-containing protein [Candidatus Acidoferrales bacterium]